MATIYSLIKEALLNGPQVPAGSNNDQDTTQNSPTSFIDRHPIVSGLGVIAGGALGGYLGKRYYNYSKAQKDAFMNKVRKAAFNGNPPVYVNRPKLITM